MTTFNDFCCYIMYLSDSVTFSFPIGTESASLVKRDVPAEIEKITKYLHDLSAILTTTTTELVEKIKAHDLASQAE